MAHEPTCFYCNPTPQRDEIMVEVASLGVSTLFLFRDQTYRGRCLVAHRDHTKEVFDLDEAGRTAYFNDVAAAARAVQTVFGPDKLNYGAFADKNPHLHFHLVPKYKDGPQWGSTFVMNPEPKVTWSEAEYALAAEKLRVALRT